MFEKEYIDLSKYRFEKAENCLKSAENDILTNDYDSACNRSYYAILHAMRAVIALEGKDYKKHSAVMSCFRANYIKTGILDTGLSDTITSLFNLRNSSDYDDFYVISKDDVIKQFENAKCFIKEVQKYLSSKYKVLLKE